MDELVFSTWIVINQIYETVIDVVVVTYNFFYDYSEFCVDHNMV
jgi:hypothetical protein